MHGSHHASPAYSEKTLNVSFERKFANKFASANVVDFVLSITGARNYLAAATIEPDGLHCIDKRIPGCPTALRCNYPKQVSSFGVPDFYVSVSKGLRNFCQQ